MAARLDPAAVSAYLLFGSVCEPLTLVEGVRSLPPGYSMSVAAGAPRHRHASRCGIGTSRRSLHQAAAADKPDQATPSPSRRVRSLLEDAVASHLVADVPVGVFLSSGLDSTALAALASRAQRGIHTFTVAFTDSAFSEAEIARRTAKALGTEHSELTLSDAEMVARLDEAISSFDQPSMDGINTYFVSWAARQAGLKVALSGLGSDEIFGGYYVFPRHFQSRRRPWPSARFFPVRCARCSLAAHAGRDESSPAARAMRGAKVWLRFRIPMPFRTLTFSRGCFSLRKPSLPQPERHDSSTAWCTLALVALVFGFGARGAIGRRVHAVSWLELRSYLVNTLLRDTDAMSMRHSLEVRVPFLDAPLVEYVLSLPESAKLDRARPKALLVDAVRELLPEEVLSQSKRTFTFPWNNWLRGALGKRVAAGTCGLVAVTRAARTAQLRSRRCGRIFSTAAPRGRVRGACTS